MKMRIEGLLRVFWWINDNLVQALLLLYRILICLQYFLSKTITSMKFIKKLKSAVEMADFFNSTQMLRYQKQNQYRTFTGGIISLGIIITILFGFAHMILDTLNLTTITYTQNEVTQANPSPTTLLFSPQNQFMFGVEIWRQNLSSSQRYFDFYSQIYVEEAGVATKIDFNLVQCTKEHWSSMPNMVDNFDKLQISGWLCPPINSTLQIMGKYTSDLYKQLVFTVRPCNNNSDASRLCAPQSEIDKLFSDNSGWFYFTFYYINAIVNPDQPNYKTYYLQDTAYVIFSNQMGIQSMLYFSDYDIETDYSIWPFENISSDIGFQTLHPPTGHPYPITPDNNANYLTFSLAKSPSSLTYTRQVQKISVVFSFIGGLVGALLAGLFIINQYTSFSFEISIALQIFKKENDQNEKDPGSSEESIISVIQFIRYYWFQIRKFMNKDYQDSYYEHILTCRQEIIRQLDIKSLIKRIIFLEYSLTFIFSDYQLEGLQLHKPTYPFQVRAVRKKIQNVQNADQESIDADVRSHSKQKRTSQVLEPMSTFNLGAFLGSAKVANLNNLSTHPELDNNIGTPMPCKIDVVVQDVSEMSIEQKRRKYDRQIKKQTLLKGLQKSAKQGNQLSKRIWNSYKHIQQNYNKCK